MVLLTSSHVQVAVSSTIIFCFTVLLFLSGYVIQQRTVESLHVAIRPRSPAPRHKSPAVEIAQANPTGRLSRPFGRLRDRARWQSHLSSQDEPFDWSRLAYAQLVRDHSEVCNALILLGDLHRLRSPAPRLLLFPQHWVKDVDGETLDPFLETSRRLLKKASRRYRAILVPIEPAVSGGKLDDPASYSISTLFALHQYDRILTLPPPGLVLDSRPLDSILAFSDVANITAYPSLNTTSTLSSLLVIKPLGNGIDSTSKTLATSDLDVLNSAFPTPPQLLSDTDTDLFPTSLFATSFMLRTSPSFNATDFLSSTVYIHFADPELPGPEYEVPYSSIVKMRPKGEDQGFLWEKMYSTFKDRRYGVCGLDLEIWPPVAAAEKAQENEEAKEIEQTKTDL